MLDNQPSQWKKPSVTLQVFKTCKHMHSSLLHFIQLSVASQRGQQSIKVLIAVMSKETALKARAVLQEFDLP